MMRLISSTLVYPAASGPVARSFSSRSVVWRIPTEMPFSRRLRLQRIFDLVNSMAAHTYLNQNPSLSTNAYS